LNKTKDDILHKIPVDRQGELVIRFDEVILDNDRLLIILDSHIDFAVIVKDGADVIESRGIGHVIFVDLLEKSDGFVVFFELDITVASPFRGSFS
jgi:hypothetical protein